MIALSPYYIPPRIVESGSEDLPILAEIHSEAFARGWSDAEFEAVLASGNAFALIERSRLFGIDRASGFVLVRMVADEAEILSIAVRRSRRGRGCGRRLMEAALRRIYAEGAAAVFLEVDEGNAAASALYRSLGFVEVGRRSGYYARSGAPSATALVMRLHLR